MITSSILRIIEGVQNNDIEKVVRYALNLIPNEEREDAEEIIRECFNTNASNIIMDDIPNEVEMLRDQLDVLYMQYLSQVSLWKSRCEELEKKVKTDAK